MHVSQPDLSKDPRVKPEISGSPPMGGETFGEKHRDCYQSTHFFSIKRTSWKRFHKANTHSFKNITILTQRCGDRRGIALPKTLRSSAILCDPLRSQRLCVESKTDLSRRSHNSNVLLTLLPAGTVDPRQAYHCRGTAATRGICSRPVSSRTAFSWRMFSLTAGDYMYRKKQKIFMDTKGISEV